MAEDELITCPHCQAEIKYTREDVVKHIVRDNTGEAEIHPYVICSNDHKVFLPI